MTDLPTDVSSSDPAGPGDFHATLHNDVNARVNSHDGRLDALEVGGATGVGSMRLTVASHTAPLYVRNRADVVCTGTADDVTINTAIKAATNAYKSLGTRIPFGGEQQSVDQYISVELSEGVFQLDGPIKIPARGFSMKGQGQATVLYTAEEASWPTATAAGCLGGSEKAVIMVEDTPAGNNAFGNNLSDFVIDGDYNSEVWGIFIDLSVEPTESWTKYGYPYNLEDSDGAWNFDNLVIILCKGGIWYRSTDQMRGTHITNCDVRGSYSDGYYINCSDAHVANSGAISARTDSPTDPETTDTAYAGFKIHGGNANVIGCKVSYWGKANNVGFYVLSSRSNITHCEAQDCVYGFVVRSGSGQPKLVACRADNQLDGTSGWSVPETGFYMDTSDYIMEGCHVQARGGTKWKTGIRVPSSAYGLVNGFVANDLAAGGAYVRNGSTAVADSDGMPANSVAHIVRGGTSPLIHPATSPSPPVTAGRVGGTADGGNVSSLAVALPAATADGDVAVAAIVYSGSGNGPLSVPTGWTEIGSEVVFSASMAARLFYKTVAGDTQIDFGTLGSTNKATGAVEVLRGVNSPYDVFSTYFANDGTVTNHDAGQLTPTAAAYVVGFGFERSSTPSTSIVSGAGYTDGVEFYQTGGGATSVRTAYTAATVPAALFAPGDYVADVANPGWIAFNVALTET